MQRKFPWILLSIWESYIGAARIFSVGTLGSLKDYQAPAAEGRLIDLGHFQSMIIRLNAFQNAFQRKDNVRRGVARILFRGGMPRPINGYHAPLAGGPGGGDGPPDGSEFHFLKQFKVFLMNSFFSKMLKCFFPKRYIFSKINLGKLNIFYENFCIFSKNYFTISLFIISYKFREGLCEF